jgi:hypothetical protein
MTITQFGAVAAASTTVSASPTPTTTVFTVASSTGFYEQTWIQVLVSAVYERTKISSIVGNVITVSPALSGAPDAPGSVEDRGELLTNERLNELVDGINDNTSAVSSVSSSSKFGGGIHGTGQLGSLSNPSATITAVAGATGLITGTVRYRVTFFNLSGETTATADPGADISVTSKQITVGAIPVSGSSTCQGRGIYRSTNSGSTWHQVGKLYNNTDTTWTDNNPYTGGSSVPGSNTTGTTGTLEGGEWQFTDFTIATGQTLTISDTGSQGGIAIIRSQSTIDIVGTLTGTGKFLRTGYPAFYSEVGRTAEGRYYQLGINGIDSQNNTNELYGPSQRMNLGGGQTKASYGANGWIDALRKIGAGGLDGAGSNRGYAGSTICMLASGAFTLTGTINNNGGNCSAAASGNAGGGGGGGGIVLLYSSASVITSAGTINCTGGNGSNGNGTGGGQVAQGGGGGGGGFIVRIAPIVSSAGTESVAAGTGGTASAHGSLLTAASGGMSAGDAGNGGNPGQSGSSGQSVTLRQATLPVVI